MLVGQGKEAGQFHSCICSRYGPIEHGERRKRHASAHEVLSY